MSILRQIVAHFAVTADDAALGKLDQGIGKVKAALGALGVAIGAAKIVDWVQDTANAADQLQDVADAAGISTDSLQAWNFAAKLNGLSAEAMAGSLTILNRNLAAAASGGAEQGKTLNRLGVSFRGAGGEIRALDDLLPEIAEGISKVSNPTEQAGLAMQLFGRSGAQLLPLLRKGASGVEELREEFGALGGGYTQDAIDAAGEYNDQLDRMEVVTRSLKSKALMVLLPAFQLTADIMTRAGQVVSWITEKTYLLEAALGLAGTAASVFAVSWIAANRAVLLSTLQTWGPLLVKFGLAAAGVLFVVGVIEDLLVLFDGGKSAIGEFVDALFGIGTAEEVIISLKRGFDELVYAAQKAGKLLAWDFDGARALKTPEQMVEERRNNAVASGNVDAFVADRAFGQSREEGRGSFLEHRRRYLIENPNAATEQDVNAGIATKAKSSMDGLMRGDLEKTQEGERLRGAFRGASAAASAPKSGRAPVNHAPTTNITVNLPPGDPREQAERVRGVVSEELDKKNRQAAAMLGSVAAP